MKKLFGVALIGMTALLCSCSQKVQNSSGVVDCYSVSVSTSGKTVFDGKYSKGKSKVYEYKNEDGEYVYTNTQLNSIKIYANDYDEYDYEEYTLKGFIGYLSVEYNYLYDIDKNVIESRVVFSEYPIATTTTMDEKADNKKAFECAKKGYYTTNQQKIIKTIEEDDLERSTYRKVGTECVVAYQAKWF